MSADYILIYKAKNGDFRALDTIIRRYYGDVFNFCACHAVDVHTAEDLTQDTFSSFFEKIGEYRHCGKLLNYLYTIARNKCIDESRKNKNTDVCIEYVADKLVSEKTDIEEREEQMHVRAAVNSLPSELRESIILFYFLDKRQKDIAEICGISLPLVKYRLKEGKKKIREYLERRS